MSDTPETNSLLQVIDDILKEGMLTTLGKIDSLAAKWIHRYTTHIPYLRSELRLAEYNIEILERKLTAANEQLEQLEKDYAEQFNELEDKQCELEDANALLDECKPFVKSCAEHHYPATTARNLLFKLQERKG